MKRKRRAVAARYGATVDVGIAQTGSDETAPWAVLLLDGGIVYPRTRADGVRWSVGDRLAVICGGVTRGENHAVLGALTAQPTGSPQ